MAGAVSGAICISRWESVTGLSGTAICLPYRAREIPKPEFYLRCFREKLCKGDLRG